MNDFITIEEIIVDKIREFRTSKAYKQMIEGEKYYNGEVEEPLYHNFFKLLIDEKIDYFLSGTISFSADHEEYIKNIQKILGKKFNSLLKKLAKESSKKGQAWLNLYYDEQMNLRMRMIKAEEIIPLYDTEDEDQLEAIIRFYNQEVYMNKERKTITRVEYWTREDVNFYILEDENKLILDSEKYLEEDYEGHYKKGNQVYTYPQIPFICFKNNEEKHSDFYHIAELIKSYSSNRYHLQSLLDEVREHIYLLKGYGGEDKREFINDLNTYGICKLEEDGDLSYLTPQIDTTATEFHTNLLKKDIYLIGQGVNFLDENFNQSGIALKIKFRNLDLKVNNTEAQFKEAFQELMKFLLLEDQNIDIHFVRQQLVNELELIQSISESKNTGIISNETLLSKHPFVTDIMKEKEKVKREQEEKLNLYDFTMKEESLNE